ncbi:MAG: DUF599 domain-containing protein [Gallionellaceae bacterium]|nr:DUF599 domain-containing protein [Gallionellaceae bacterium]
MDLLKSFGVDLAAFLFSAMLIGAYYLFLNLRLRKDPTYTIQGVNELARALWVINVMNNPSRDIMAVQTLRNFIMGASLMASTAALLIIGTLTLSGQAENIAHSWHVLNLISAHSAEIWIIKVLCLLIDFIVAFFAFAMSVRLANQVVFMINVPDPGAHPSLSPHGVGQRLNRAGSLFTIGMRAFFFAVPLVFWLFGPVFLMIATTWLVFSLYRLDRSDPSS